MNPIYAEVECLEHNVRFYISLRSLKNNENVCSHCPFRHECDNRKNVHIHPYDMLRIDMHTPKKVEI